MISLEYNIFNQMKSTRNQVCEWFQISPPPPSGPMRNACASPCVAVPAVSCLPAKRSQSPLSFDKRTIRNMR